VENAFGLQHYRRFGFGVLRGTSRIPGPGKPGVSNWRSGQANLGKIRIGATLLCEKKEGSGSTSGRSGLFL